MIELLRALSNPELLIELERQGYKVDFKKLVETFLQANNHPAPDAIIVSREVLSNER